MLYEIVTAFKFPIHIHVRHQPSFMRIGFSYFVRLMQADAVLADGGPEPAFEKKFEKARRGEGMFRIYVQFHEN